MIPTPNLIAQGSLYINNPALNRTIGDITVTTSGSRIVQMFLVNFINIIFVIGTVIFLFMLLIGGYQYITSGGDKEAVQKAQKRITHALIGLVILFSVYAILNLASLVFGLNLVYFNIPGFS